MWAQEGPAQGMPQAALRSLGGGGFPPQPCYELRTPGRLTAMREPFYARLGVSLLEGHSR